MEVYIHYIVHILLRNWLQVEKRFYFWGYNHLNEEHKKVDWTIRISSIVLLTLGFIINHLINPLQIYWFLELEC